MERETPKVILVAEASGGLGAATARELAGVGHIAYAGMGLSIGPFSDWPPGAEPDGYDHAPVAHLRPIALDVADQRSVSAAVRAITAEAGRIDVVIHTTGPVLRGPIESFTPYQLAQMYDAQVLATQRVNRAVLPQMRERRGGLLVWVVAGSRLSDAAPYLALHAEAATTVDHLAASYGRELAGFGIRTAIVVSGSLTSDAGRPSGIVYPDDAETARAYERRYPGLADSVDAALAERALSDADIVRTARVIAAVVDSPESGRPLRVTDATPDGRPGADRPGADRPGADSAGSDGQPK